MLRFLFSLFSIVVVFVSSSFVIDTSGNGELALADDLISAPYGRTFTITAYYSPLPCQQRYATGSYEGDIRLNGNGTNGADGTEVYPGMVAAPKTYAFGTKMNIPGIGIVAVHDRGGAIVASSGVDGIYDRLDVWMGYGDVGLKRALNWGKRSVDVTVYGITDAVEENLTLMGYSSSESVPGMCTQPVVENDFGSTQTIQESIPKITEPVKKPEVSPFLGVNMKFGDTGASVLSLQRFLASLNLFRGDVTSYYGEVTAHAVFKFQQINGLVMEENSQFAGVLGDKTRSRMNEIIASKLYFTKKVVKSEVESVSTDVPLSFGMTGKEVKDLQLFLREQGFFSGAFLTEYFGSVTKDAVVKFQIAQGIIDSAADPFAGVVGPATLEAIRQISK